MQKEKVNVILGSGTADMIALCYTNIQSAITLARFLCADRDTPRSVQQDFLHVAAELKNTTARIDKRIPKEGWESFRDQLVENDAMRLDAIKSIYVRMTPDQQNMLEMAAGAILRKEIEYVNE